MRALLAPLAGTLFVACTPPVALPDGGPSIVLDGGAHADAGVVDDGGLVDDGGFADAGFADAGFVDAGPPLVEGEVCDVGAGPVCGPGLTCLRESLLVQIGVCTKTCGTFDDAGSVEDPSACVDAGACLTMRTPTLKILGVVCQPAAFERDAECPAALDDDACAGDPTCDITFAEDVGGTLFVDPPRCKLTCEFAPDAGGCPALEVCLPPRAPLTTGVCGTPVPLWDGNPIPDPSFVCNELNRHAYCDDRDMVGLAQPPVVECLTGLYLDPNDGLCTAQCRRPTFDYDDDGSLQADEFAYDLNCPAGTICDEQIARDNGLVHAPATTTMCDDSQCFPGEACPACDDGAECWFDPNLGYAKCVVVFGFCS